MIFCLYEEFADLTSIQEIREKLTSSNKMKMFEDVFIAYPDDAVSVFLFIIKTYSYKSTYVDVNSDWEQIKKEIAKMVNVPDGIFEEVINLSKIWASVDAYLIYQQAKEFRYLIILQENYERFLKSSLVEDYDQAYKNLEYAKDTNLAIQEAIQAARQKFGQKFTKMAEETSEQIKKKFKNSLLLEHNV